MKIVVDMPKNTAVRLKKAARELLGRDLTDAQLHRLVANEMKSVYLSTVEAEYADYDYGVDLDSLDATLAKMGFR